MEHRSSKNTAGEAARPSYRFMVRPAWLLSHLLVLALVVLMVNLGFWQLRRLDARRAFNDDVRAHASSEPVPLPAGLDASDADALEWQPVTVDGAYDTGSDVLVANRTVDGQPGYWIVTRLDPAEGELPVAVVRGFVTRTLVAEADVGRVASPTGDVTVTGYAQQSRSGGRFATGPEGGLPEISRVDLDQLAERWGTELAPVWLQLEEQRPASSDDALTAVPLPDLDQGPHLSYAIQWFIFSAIAIIGYPLILRRNARSRDEDQDDPGPTRVRAGEAIH